MNKKMLYLFACACLLVPQLGQALSSEEILESNLDLKTEINNTLSEAKETASVINSWFLEAVENNSPTKVKYYLSLGANINYSEKENKTALYIASKKGYTEIVDILLNHKNDAGKYDVIVDSKTSIKWTPLMVACYYGHMTIATKLIARGADINYQNNTDGFTPLMLAIWRGNTKTATKLLSYKNIDVNLATVTEKLTPLMLCLETPNSFGHTFFDNRYLGCHIEADYFPLFKLILSKNPDPNAKDVDGQTAVHKAAKNRPFLLELLRTKKYKVEVKDNGGNTPLHFANLDCTHTLLDYGANVNAQNNHGETPLMWHARLYTDNDILLALIMRGAKADMRTDKNWNALFFAVYEDCDLKNIDMLFKAGANPKIVDKEGRNLKDLILENGEYCYYPEIAPILGL